MSFKQDEKSEKRMMQASGSSSSVETNEVTSLSRQDTICFKQTDVTSPQQWQSLPNYRLNEMTSNDELIITSSHKPKRNKIHQTKRYKPYITPSQSSRNSDRKILNYCYYFLNNPLRSHLFYIPDLPLPTHLGENITNSLINYSRNLKYLNTSELCCQQCRHIPIAPVTEPCGYSSCMSCVQKKLDGLGEGKDMVVNILVQEICGKMMTYVKNQRTNQPGLGATSAIRKQQSIGLMDNAEERPSSSKTPETTKFPKEWTMTIQDRFREARELLRAGKMLESVPQLVRAAASPENCNTSARTMLMQVTSGPREVVSGAVGEAVRALLAQTARAVVSPSDLECVLCAGALSGPVTTPCGHTYCRTCIERLLLYTPRCPLCLAPLQHFQLHQAPETIFISSMLSAIDVKPRPPLPNEPDLIPIVTLNVAFPGIPCPLMIHSPRYSMMVRRVLESGSRKFGMLAYKTTDPQVDIGTILEIRDCVTFENGCCIISTVGVSRFKVIQRIERDWTQFARIEPLQDTPLTEDEMTTVKDVSLDVSSKVMSWLKEVDEDTLNCMWTAFGCPNPSTSRNWWQTPDGPHWLWWVIAILPLQCDVKLLILATPNLIKRFRAAERTLSLIMNSDLMFTIQLPEPFPEPFDSDESQYSMPHVELEESDVEIEEIS